MHASATDRTPAIIGFLIAGALILALGFLVGRREPSPDRGPPPLRVLSPASGDTVSNPIVLEFSTTAQLTLGRAGWTADELHLHLMLDDVEIMPAAADIAAGESSYSWRLPPVQPGSRVLYLTWAGRHHGNLPGVTDTLRLIVLP